MKNLGNDNRHSFGVFSFYCVLYEVITIPKKGVPRKDGSGHGTRDNKNRGGCNDPPKKGKGSNRE